MSFYEFNRDDAFRFASFLGIGTKIRGNNLVFNKCPYCGQSTSDKEKFAINLTTGQFNCFRASCGAKGNMITLSKDFGFSISEELDRYLNRDYTNNRFRTFKPLEYKKPSNDAVKYLGHRGISEKVCQKYEITTRSDNKDILVFPFKDDSGNLRFIKYRNTKFVKNETKGSKEWCEKDCMPILFGMAQCEDFSRLVITEGQIDSLSLAEAGIKNACSVPTGALGSTWVPHCYDWVQKFDEIVIFGDNEKGHITLVDMIQNRFSHKKVKIVRMCDYLGEKDANDILRNHGKDALITAVENAETVLNKQVRDAADIKRVDISSIPKIKSGFKRLDELLEGGFMYGQVILVTGKRGAGKSTVCSQFVCEALEQNHNAFIYSGELPDFFVKDWLDRQLTGKEHPTISQTEQCENFYRNRLFIYNNEIIDSEDSELKTLPELIEELAAQKDVKLALIDNLMTAITCNVNENLYRQQSEFVGKLARISKAYNMVIMLVAHPRKSSNEFDNDDVSGSADITNRVDVVMSYDKDSKRKQSDLRVLKVTKNRINGKVEDIDLYFSEYSKRISDTPNDFTKDYLKTDGFIQLSEQTLEEIPF